MNRHRFGRGRVAGCECTASLTRRKCLDAAATRDGLAPLILRAADLRVCLSCPPVGLDDIGTRASVGVRPSGRCMSCNGPTRQASAEERAAYRRYLETRENPARAEFGIRPMILEEDGPRTESSGGHWFAGVFFPERSAPFARICPRRTDAGRACNRDEGHGGPCDSSD